MNASAPADEGETPSLAAPPTLYGVPRHARGEPVALKPAFKVHYEQVLGKESYEQLVQELCYYLPKAVRMNALKNNPDDTAERLRKHFTLTPIPWVRDAYWVHGKRRDIGNTIEHQLGYCYIQEAASMLPPVVLAPEPGMRVLDMAASPGSKTTQLANAMNNSGVLVANDMGARMRALGINIQKCGCQCVVLTNMDGRRMPKNAFDRVLADVPCSATGTIQRSLKAASMWSESFSKKLARLQKQLAFAAYDALVPGGRMVYSTCTLEPRENEAIVSLLAHAGARVLPIDLPIRREKPFTELDGEALHPSVAHCLRIHPYTNNTEGFFVALLEKPLRE
jgi:NOL1/NOP2/sun family putative RNA methylase